MMQTTQKALRTAAGLLLVLLLVAGISAAQSATAGAISGTVTDQTGAVVPNANVRVTSNATNAVTETSSDSSGAFRVTNLTPGGYKVDVKAQSFSDYRASIIIEVGLATRLEARLKVSSAGETVQVVDEAPVVNTEHQDFSTNFNQTAINELPINGRRWSNYALLTPTGNPDGTFGLMSFRGISGLLNNNTIDGGDNNSNFYGEERGRTRLSYSISQDSVQEFQVNTSNFSAEYGRSAGAAVNTVTKSGTNQYHGSGYWYIKDNSLAATNPSTTLAGAPYKPDDRRNQFGATIGGPIVKDKIFFFFNWDQQKRNFPGDAIPLTGTNGYASYTPGAGVVAPAAGCPANNTFPAPSAAFTLGNAIFCRFAATGNGAIAQQAGDDGYKFMNSLLGITPRRGDQLILFPKVDVKIFGGNWATSYNWLNWTSPSGIQTQPTNALAKDQFGNDLVRARTLNSVYNKALSAKLAMEARFHFSTENLSGSFENQLPGQPSVNGVTGSHAPGVFITAWLGLGTQTYLPRPANPQEDQYQYAGNFTYSMGPHTIKFGGEWLHQHENVQSLSNAYGTFNYTGNYSYADYLADTYNASARTFDGSGAKRCAGTFAAPNRPCYSSFTQGVGTLGFNFGTNDYAFYFQDDWKLLKRLTLNVGVRYEFQRFPIPIFANPLLPQSNNRPEDGNNLTPRVGFAWDILGSGKLVFRGGYGVYDARVINSTIASALTSTGVANAQPSFTISPTTTSLLYPNILSTSTGLAGSPPNVAAFASNLITPVVYQGDAIVEYQVMKNTAISASFLNSQGRGLLNFLDTNLPAAYQATNKFTRPDGSTFTIPTYGTLARPNAKFNQITNIANAVDTDYNAFVVQVTRRMSAGLQFQSSYTYSKATDNGQISQTFTTGNNALDPANPKQEFGRSAFDVPHKFIFAGTWQPNYFRDQHNALHWVLDSWTLSPIVNLSSGAPFTGTIGGSLPTGNCASTHSGGINCATPGSNRAPDVEKNAFRAPGRYTTDFRTSRRFALNEKMNVEFLAEAFNLFNHPNVSGMNTGQYNVGACTGSTAANTLSCTLNANATFATPSSRDGGTNLTQRQIQFAIRFQF